MLRPCSRLSAAQPTPRRRCWLACARCSAHGACLQAAACVEASERVRYAYVHGRRTEPEDDAALDCAICLGCAAAPDAATLDCCAHRFCFDCISAWTQHDSRCPLCKRQVSSLRRAGGAAVAVEPRAQRVEWLGDVFFDEDEEEEETPCSVCGRDNDADSLLLCDAPGCSGACHVACAGLPAVPDGDWLCARCAEAPGRNLRGWRA